MLRKVQAIMISLIEVLKQKSYLPEDERIQTSS